MSVTHDGKRVIINFCGVISEGSGKEGLILGPQGPCLGKAAGHRADTQGGGASATSEAETGVRRPQAKECGGFQMLQEAGKETVLEPLEGPPPCLLYFRIASLQDCARINPSCFTPTNLWSSL